MDILQNIRDYLFDPILTGVSFIVGLLYALLLAWGGFILAVMIIAAMFREKRNPSNIFAWSLAVLLLPWVGVPLYFLFGGRKSRRLVKIKKDFMHSALAAAGVRNLAELRERLVDGNHSELLTDGVQTYEALLGEIRQAEHTIHVMTYILRRDTAGIALVKALTERARKGVRVRLLMDSFGCLGNGGDWLRELEEAGGEISRFMPLLPLHGHYSANLRNHRKLAIFDNRVVITGGQNLDLRFVGPMKTQKMFEDFSLRISGPVVQAFNFVFLSDWIFSTRQPADVFTESFRYRPEPAGECQIEVIESGPEVEEDPLYDRILSLVQECRDNLTIVTPYFVPDEVLFRSLIVKARMKRRIRLIVPRRSNHRLVDLARYHYLRKLKEAGVEIFFYMPRMLHGKLLIVDNEVGLTGSANFDMRSLFVNFEMGIVHTSRADIALLEKWVDGLLPDCKVFYGNPTSDLSFGRRFAENIAHLAGPML